MNRPIVALVGRPNVGKSCMFNRIVRERKAVVDDTPGVTRDRNYALTSWNGIEFFLTDTGGLLPSTRDDIFVQIKEQVDLAIDESDAIIFITDAQTGALEPDLLIARHLRKKAAEKLILVANKAESRKTDDGLAGFLSLGCGEPFFASALHGNGIGDILDQVAVLIGKRASGANRRALDRVSVNIAVVGRPNAGKSSLVNKILGKKRMIVHDSPGTTRDAIDSFITHNDTHFRLIDTAGLRQKSHVKTHLEYYANLRAIAGITRCDVAVLVVDTHAGFGEQDMKIFAQITAMRKGAVICLNKWDLVEKDNKTFDRTVAGIRRHFHQLAHVPFVSVSALTGQRAADILGIAAAVHQRMRNRVSPALLRELLFTGTRRKPHPVVKGHEVRILGGKQADGSYPFFRIYTTNAPMMKPSYGRYIASMIYEHFDFDGCPVVLTFKTPAKPSRRNPAGVTAAEHTP